MQTSQVEYSVGLSWRAYRGLDFVALIVSGGGKPPAEGSHWVLNSMQDPLQRPFILPELWYFCRDWLSWGQMPSMSESQKVVRPENQAMALARVKDLEARINADPGNFQNYVHHIQQIYPEYLNGYYKNVMRVMMDPAESQKRKALTDQAGMNTPPPSRL